MLGANAPMGVDVSRNTGEIWLAERGQNRVLRYPQYNNLLLNPAANLALAALPGFTLPGDISATDRYYEEDITNERFTLNPDSTIDVPQRPGLGVTINPQAVERATIETMVVG